MISIIEWIKFNGILFIYLNNLLFQVESLTTRHNPCALRWLIYMDCEYILYTANMLAPNGHWNVYRKDSRGGVWGSIQGEKYFQELKSFHFTPTFFASIRSHCLKVANYLNPGSFYYLDQGAGKGGCQLLIFRPTTIFFVFFFVPGSGQLLTILWFLFVVFNSF